MKAPRFDAPYLGEFTVELGRGTAEEFLDRLRRRKVLGGHSLRDPRPGAATDAERILVGIPEATGEKDIQKYVRAAQAAIGAVGRTA